MLIAADDQLIRLGLRALLAACPDLAVAGDGPCEVDRVAALAASRRPDVAVVGGADAVAVVARLRAEVADCRLLVLAAGEGPAAARRAVEAGADGYALLRSPADELVRAVRAVAAGGGYLDPGVAAGVARDYRADGLSEREARMLALAAQGFGNRDIAARLRLSVKAICLYKRRAMRQLGLRSRADLVRFAAARGWLAGEPAGATPAPPVPSPASPASRCPRVPPPVG